MKLFISYGHDHHQDFGRRIKGDLEALGHFCRIDTDRIHEHPDWRRSLMEALHECDWTVGFLSRWSMRPGSVTPQELAIAHDVKAQAGILHERFPQDPGRNAYLRWAADLLAQACGPAA